MVEVEHEVELILLLDFDYTPACEGETHARSLHGHQAAEPASWVLVMPCCGPKLLVCEPRRAHIRSEGDIKCGGCETWHDTHTLTFLPIEPRTP